MTSNETIGGYLELELPYFGNFPHRNALLVNSGRNAFELILGTLQPRRVHLPFYTCDAMLPPLERAGIAHQFYSVTEALEPPDGLDPAANECLVYTNYFGLKDAACDRLVERFGDRLILDCSQALFYRPPAGAAAFYSPRKFVGIPDGAAAYGAAAPDDLEEDRSEPRFAHLLGRIARGAEGAYADFQRSEAELGKALPRRMSALTLRLLDATDFVAVARRRRDNYALLHALLGATNRLGFELDHGAVPLAYPYLGPDPDLRRRLIDAKVFVPTFWPNVRAWSPPGSWDRELADRLLPLPIDQRYGRMEMERVARLAR